MPVLDTEKLLTAFEVEEPTAYISEVMTASELVFFQSRSQPLKITVGGEAGVRTIVISTSTLPAVFRTTVNIIDPAGDIAGTYNWEDELQPSGSDQRAEHDLWFTLDQGGTWEVDVILESVIPGVGDRVVDREYVGFKVGDEAIEAWAPSFKTIGIIGGVFALAGLGLILAKRK